MDAKNHLGFSEQSLSEADDLVLFMMMVCNVQPQNLKYVETPFALRMVNTFVKGANKFIGLLSTSTTPTSGGNNKITPDLPPPPTKS